MTEATGSEIATSNDTLLGGRVRIYQPVGGYRAAIDPVLLAAAVPAVPGQTVLDAGAGTGAAALCLLSRVANTSVTGIELQPQIAALARRNAQANDFDSRFTVVEGDVSARPSPIAANSVDHVMANPPYLLAGRGNPPPDAAKAVATIEGPGGLDAWLDFSTATVRPGGTVTIIHRGDRLGDLLAGFGSRLGSIVVLPLWPAVGKAAGRVIVAGVKDGRAPLILHPGILLHEADGTFTASAQAILRNGAALDLDMVASNPRH